MGKGVAVGFAGGVDGVGVGLAVGEGVGVDLDGGATVGIAAIVALKLSETVASIIGFWVGVVVGVGVGLSVEVGFAEAVVSRGIAVSGVDSLHATSDTSITWANFNKRFLFQVKQRPLVSLLPTDYGAVGAARTATQWLCPDYFPPEHTPAAPLGPCQPC